MRALSRETNIPTQAKGKLRNAIPWVAFTSLLLGVLYFGLHTFLGGRKVSGAHSHTYRLSISVPRPGQEFPVFKAAQGDTVTILISSDRAGQVHVHGYGETIDLTPGGEVTLMFSAQKPGFYPLHLHERLHFDEPAGPILHRHLAALEVQPQ
jgi:hypothetical protein